MKYRADIDGLRAIAVLPVVLFHAGVSTFSGGFAGVNVFFVISGYLITNIIFPQLRDGTFSLRVFYQKRADRLFPVLFAMLAAVIIAGFLVSPPGEYRDLLASALAAATFTANIFFWQTQDYFAASAFNLPLLHTWSLGVEEQFYIFFPLFLLVVCRLRLVTAGILLALAGSFLLSVFFIDISLTGTFYLLPTRAWELLIGACIALRVIPPLRSPSMASAAGLAGAVMLIVTYLLYSKSTLFPAHYALLPTLGAALIIMAGEHPGSPVNRLLSYSVFTLTGKASYSIYMWHWPIIVFYGLLFGFPTETAGKWLLVTLSLAAGFASWQLIERPTRGRLSRISPRKTAFASAALFAPVMVFAGYGIASQGVPQRVEAEVLTAEQATLDFSQYRAQCHWDEFNSQSYGDSCVLGDKETPPDVVVWGDSHGVEIAAALGEHLAAQGRSLRQVTYSACPPTTGGTWPRREACARHNEGMIEAIIADDSVRYVVLTAYYRVDPSTFGHFAEGLEASVVALRDADKQVIISYPLPTTDVDMPRMFARRLMLGEMDQTIIAGRAFRQQFAQAFELVDRLRELPGVAAVSSYEAFCSEACRLGDDKGVYFFDRHHLSMHGARQLSSLYAAMLEPQPVPEPDITSVPATVPAQQSIVPE